MRGEDVKRGGRLATIIKTNSSWLILQPSSSSSSSSPSSLLIALYLNLYHNNVTLPRVYTYIYIRAPSSPSSFSATPSCTSRLEKKSWKGATRRIRVRFSHTRTWRYRVNRKMAYFVEHDAPGSDANRSRNYETNGNLV